MTHHQLRLPHTQQVVVQVFIYIVYMAVKCNTVATIDFVHKICPDQNQVLGIIKRLIKTSNQNQDNFGPYYQRTMLHVTSAKVILILSEHDQGSQLFHTAFTYHV